MSFQKCPVCEGTGLMYDIRGVKNCLCDVCKGCKIISTVSGYPPCGTAQVKVDLPDPFTPEVRGKLK